MKLIDKIKTCNTKEMAYLLTCMIRRKVLPTNINIDWKMDEESTYLFKALVAFLNTEVDETFEQYRYNLRRKTNE